MRRLFTRPLPDSRPAAPQAAACARWITPGLAAGLCLVLAAPAWTASAPSALSSAASTAMAQASGRSFAIAPGPLTHVVAQYANQAGVALSFDAAQLGQRQSPGLQGQYTVEAGFAKLLEGTALQAVREASGVYSLRALPVAGAAAAGSTTLGTVTVRAPAPDNARTEASGSYGASQVTAFKGLSAARDIPQPLTVLTRQWLEDRALPDLHEVLKHTPGLTVDYVDSERINYYARGHQIDSLQVDGLPINQVASSSIFIQPDTAVLDRIEVLRGATGMLRGAGTPSATVNMVRKRPTREFQGQAAMTLGSWDHHRLEADLSGPLNEAGTLRGRLVALADEKNSFQQGRSEERQMLYGVLEADLGPRTTLTASLQHTGLNATGAWGGLPADLDGSQLNLPRSTYLGTDWNRWDRHNQQAFIALAHGMDNGWKLQASAAHTRFRTDGFKQPSFTSASTTNPYLFDVSTSVYSGNASDQNAISLTASGPVDLLGRTHTLTVGADTLHVRTTGSTGYWGLNPVTNIDIRSWNPSTSYAEPFYSEGNGTAYTAPSSGVHQHGLYSTARLSLSDALNLVLGGRLSWWEYREPASPASNYSVRREFTPYTGLVYALSEQLSAYASYSEIFNPQNQKNASGQVLEPVRGKDLEAGFKGEFMDGRLQGSLSFFRIHSVGNAMEDTATANPCLPYYPTTHCYVAGGKTRSQGWELELAGEIAPGWQLQASYTQTQTRYLRDATAANVGQPLRPADPRHAVRLFTSKRLDGALQGWTVGAGARIQSDAYTRVGDLTTRQGGYAVFDALLAYRFNRFYAVQLNVNNLLDKHYYAKFSPNASYFNNYYGDPRNVTLSLRASF